jgi:hypothetical protein
MADKKNDTEGPAESRQAQGSEAGQAPPKLKKMEGVRRALKALGKNATPGEIIDHLEKEFAIEMTREQVSKYKSEILRKAAAREKAAETPAAPKPAGRKPGGRKARPAASAKAGNRTGVSLEDVLAIRGLVGRVGADRLRILVDALSG